MPAHRSTHDLQLLRDLVELVRCDTDRLAPEVREREVALVRLLRSYLEEMHDAQARRTRERSQTLTTRQRELLGMVAGGQTNRQIAHSLGIAEGTVRKHLENAYARLGVDNRVAAIDRAFGAWPDVSAP